MSEKLEKCPFCGVNPYIGMIGRDWYRLTAHHDENCILHLYEEDAPQTEEQRQLLIKAWNTRHIPKDYALVPVESTKEMEDAFDSALCEALDDRNRKPGDGFKAAHKAMIKAAQKNT